MANPIDELPEEEQRILRESFEGMDDNEVIDLLLSWMTAEQLRGIIRDYQAIVRLCAEDS